MAPPKKAAPKTPPPPSPQAQSQQADAEASSAASARASASDDVVADAGPAFDPERPPPVQPSPLEDESGAAGDPLPEWEEQAIADLLGVKGRVLHAAAGAAEQDWIYTELDLAAIAPPLTRICNRYHPVRQYAGYGDPITVSVGLAGYVTRSVIERRQALEGGGAPPTETPIPPAPEPGPVPPPGPPPPSTRDTSPGPGDDRRSRTTPAPPPPPPAAINAEELPWERNG